VSSPDSAGLADPAALEDAARRLDTEAAILRAQVQDEVRPVVASLWAGAAATSYKDDTQLDWSSALARASALENMASRLRGGAAAIRAEIERRRREREAREAAARAASHRPAAKKAAATP
jgi:uncharacterized protein YukE